MDDQTLWDAFMSPSGDEKEAESSEEERGQRAAPPAPAVCGEDPSDRLFEAPAPKKAKGEECKCDICAKTSKDCIQTLLPKALITTLTSHRAEQMCPHRAASQLQKKPFAR
jgi:hypothetical protein